MTDIKPNDRIMARVREIRQAESGVVVNWRAGERAQEQARAISAQLETRTDPQPAESSTPAES